MRRLNKVTLIGNLGKDRSGEPSRDSGIGRKCGCGEVFVSYYRNIQRYEWSK